MPLCLTLIRRGNYHRKIPFTPKLKAKFLFNKVNIKTPSIMLIWLIKLSPPITNLANLGQVQTQAGQISNAINSYQTLTSLLPQNNEQFSQIEKELKAFESYLLKPNKVKVLNYILPGRNQFLLSTKFPPIFNYYHKNKPPSLKILSLPPPVEKIILLNQANPTSTPLPVKLFCHLSKKKLSFIITMLVIKNRF